MFKSIVGVMPQQAVYATIKISRDQLAGVYRPVLSASGEFFRILPDNSIPVSDSSSRKEIIAVQIKGLTSAVVNLNGSYKGKTKEIKVQCGSPIYFDGESLTITSVKGSNPVAKFLNVVDLDVDKNNSTNAHCIISLGCSYGIGPEKQKGVIKKNRRQSESNTELSRIFNNFLSLFRSESAEPPKTVKAPETFDKNNKEFLQSSYNSKCWSQRTDGRGSIP